MFPTRRERESTYKQWSAPALVWCSSVAILKFLIILSLNLCCIIEIWWDNGTWVGAITCACLSPIPCCSTHTQVSWCPTITEFWWPFSVGEFSKTQSETIWQMCYVHGWVSKCVDSPDRSCFPYELEWALNTERRQWCSKKYGSRNII